MNRKLFELIYLMILRQDIKPDEAYDMLKDYFRLTEIAEREDVNKLNPTIKKCDPVDLGRLTPMIDDHDLIVQPHTYPYDGITWTGGPYTTTGNPNILDHTCISTAYTSGDNTLHVTCNDNIAITTCTSASVVAVPTSVAATA